VLHEPAPAVRVIFAGQFAITGAWVSFTLTVNEQVAVLLAASVTVSKTVVVPTLNVFVPGCPLPLREVTPVVLQVNDSPVQLSSKVFDGIATLAKH